MLMNPQVKSVIEVPVVDQRGDFMEVTGCMVSGDEQIRTLLADDPLHPFERLNFAGPGGWPRD